MRRPRRGLGRGGGFVPLVLGPVLLLLAAFYLYPAVFNLANSFTDLSLYGLKRGGAWIGLDNYWELVTSAEFRLVLWNTVVWLTLVGVGVRMVLGLLLALLINSRTVAKYRLTTLCRLSLIVPWAMPPIVAVMVWRWLLDARVGAIDAALVWLGVIHQPIVFLGTPGWIWPSLITIITWNTLPLVTLTFLASLQSLPGELVEAAELDGANRWQTVRHIYLPHLKPAIVVMALLSTFWTFNNFVYVWLSTGAGPGLYTDVMATDVYLKAFVDGRMGYSAAVGVVMAAIMVGFGLVYLRLIGRRTFRDEL